MNLEQIKIAVENSLGICLESKSRAREYADGRALYYQLSRVLTRSSLRRIGALVNRHHSTVIHGLRHVFIYVEPELYTKLKTELEKPTEYFTNIKR